MSNTESLYEGQCGSRATLYDDLGKTEVRCDLGEGHTRTHGHWHEDGHVIAQWVEYLDSRAWIGIPLARKPYEFESERGVSG